MTKTEIGGGSSSGGSGTSVTKVKYTIEVEDSNNNKAIIPISKETFDNYLVEMNQVGQTLATALGITWETLETIEDVKDYFDTLKVTQYAYCCDLAMNLLVKYAYESGENPVLNKPTATDIIYTINQIIKYYLQNNFLGAVRSLDYSDGNDSTRTISH